jgi:hypothetical protein
MATPQVAGAFAILRQAVPNARVGWLLRVLACTGVPVARGDITKPRIDLLPAYDVLTGSRFAAGQALGEASGICKEGAATTVSAD